jgi:hypothetical protein
MGMIDRAQDGHDETTTLRYSPHEPHEPVATICRAVTQLTGRDPTDLTPLARVVDLDAVQSLFGIPSGGTATDSDDSPAVTFSFTYEGCMVTVTRNEVRVSASDPGSLELT